MTKHAEARGDPAGTAMWNAQVALANCLTKHPGLEIELGPVIALVGEPPGWMAGDGLIDPETRPPDIAPPEILDNLGPEQQPVKESA